MKYLIAIAFLTFSLMAEECPTVNQINNTHSPLEMYQKLPTCFDAKRYDDAVILYLISQAYGKYDTLRVSDRSAHQAMAVLRMSISSMIGTEQITEFQNALNPHINDRTKICSILKKLGQPNYHPSYMINHGLKAFGGPQLNGGINIDFQPEIAWQDTLQGYMKCTQ